MVKAYLVKGDGGVILGEGRVLICYLCFFFQAEDGIRDWSVTGVQTCALPIFHSTHMSVFDVHKTRGF